jgi:transposase
MLTQLTGQDLPQWIAGTREAKLPGLASFAKGLEQDLDAVTLGLTTPWNSGGGFVIDSGPAGGGFLPCCS